MMFATCVFSLSMALLAADPAESAWAGFRGPLPAGVHSSELPLTWSPTENMAWQAKIDGYGQSSPVVWGDHVYVTSVEGPNKEQCKITAYDWKSGKPTWQYGLRNATPQKSIHYLSKAAPTPVVDDLGIIALFEGGNVFAATHEGNDRWHINLVEKHGPIKSQFGLGSSLAQNDNVVFVWIEREEDPYLVALSKINGEPLWKVEGLKTTSWSTPVLLQVGDNQHLLLSGNGLVRGLDPETGETLWTVEGVAGNTTPSPQPAGDGLFLLGASVGRGEKGGPPSSPTNVLAKVEKNSDGKFGAKIVWKAKQASSSFGSPIVHRGLAYFVNTTGVLFCLDMANGEEVYSQRIADSVWATPLAVDDRIYFVGHRGTTTVVQAGREFRRLAENRLWTEEEKRETSPEKNNGDSKKVGGEAQQSGTGAAPVPTLYAIAAVPGHLLIRRGDVLYCLTRSGSTP